MTDRLARLLERLGPVLGEAGGAPELLGGGITNHNYKVRFGRGDYVVRITNPESGALLIDRAAEHAAAISAARLGVGAEVAAWLPDEGCLVTAFIAGRPIPPEELRQPGTLAVVAAAVRAFHQGPAIPSTFNVFRVVEAYARTARERGAPLPPEAGAASRIAREIEGCLRGEEHVPVPCHNDLLNANLIRDAAGVRIVDWEYAGMGDRYFDLGNFSINNGLGESDDESLLAAYFGPPCTSRRFACLRLMRVMSDFREAMWGVVQSVVSPVQFDYGEYAARHFFRLLQSAADARHAAWLGEARGG